MYSRLLQGWLPQWTIDQALAGELMKFLENIRKYVVLKAASQEKGGDN